jgi:hypothetical protein
MSDDLRPLRQLLRQAISASGLTVRTIETQVGLGHGKLEHLLDGRQDLRVRHILAFARVLRVPPQDFLALGCPGAQELAKYRLKDWIEPPSFGPRSAEKNGGAEPELAELVSEAVRKALADSFGSEELSERIRGVVREELDSSKREPGGRSDR